jgi:signal peptidase I
VTSENPTTPQQTGLARVWEWTKSIAVALVMWYILTSFLIQAFRIPSGSMERTLLDGDFLFANKALYGAEIPLIKKRLPAFREPRRLDIVIFDSKTEPDVNVVKRVIGMPGDTIAMVSNVVYIDGKPLDEPYVMTSDDAVDAPSGEMRSWQVHYLIDADPRAYRPTLRNWGPLMVPADSFFVMGDNRDNSYDSRYWGYLGRDRIRGHPMFVYYSYDKTGDMPLPFLTSIRWNRILSRLN